MNGVVMNTGEMEKYLFKRYKDFVRRQLLLTKSSVISHWEVIQELEVILNTFFEYDFPYTNNHYMAIKNEKTVYEYDV